jgi:hypothetical protein
VEIEKYTVNLKPAYLRRLPFLKGRMSIPAATWLSGEKAILLIDCKAMLSRMSLLRKTIE